MKYGSSTKIIFHLAPPILPVCQKRKLSITCEFGNMIVFTNDISAIDVAAPASANLIGVAPLCPTEAIP